VSWCAVTTGEREVGPSQHLGRITDGAQRELRRLRPSLWSTTSSDWILLDGLGGFQKNLSVLG